MLFSEPMYCVAIAFMMTAQVQRIHIKFCIKLEYPLMETVWMIQKYFRDDAMSEVQLKVWYKYFKNGQ